MEKCPKCGGKLYSEQDGYDECHNPKCRWSEYAATHSRPHIRGGKIMNSIEIMVQKHKEKVEKLQDEIKKLKDYIQKRQSTSEYEEGQANADAALVKEIKRLKEELEKWESMTAEELGEMIAGM